jgi:PAS domain S-box-containing protein
MLIISGALLNYLAGFNGPWFQLFTFSPDFIVLFSSPVLLSLGFYFIAFRRERPLALKKSEEEKAVVLNNTQAIICLHDMEGRIIDINPAAERLSGFKKEEAIGRSLNMIIAKEYLPQFDEYIRRINVNETATGTIQVITRAVSKESGCTGTPCMRITESRM